MVPCRARPQPPEIVPGHPNLMTQPLEGSQTHMLGLCTRIVCSHLIWGTLTIELFEFPSVVLHWVSVVVIFRKVFRVHLHPKSQIMCQVPIWPFKSVSQTFFNGRPKWMEYGLPRFPSPWMVVLSPFRSFLWLRRQSSPRTSPRGLKKESSLGCVFLCFFYLS